MTDSWIVQESGIVSLNSQKTRIYQKYVLLIICKLRGLNFLKKSFHLVLNTGSYKYMEQETGDQKDDQISTKIVICLRDLK